MGWPISFFSTFSTTLIWTIWIDSVMAVTQRGVMHDQVVFYRLVPLLDVRCSNKSASGNVDLVPEKGMLDKRYCIQVSLCKLGSTCSTHESVIFIAVFDIKITRCMYCRLTSIEFNSKCETGWAEQLYFVQYRRPRPSIALQIYEYYKQSYHAFCRHPL